MPVNSKKDEHKENLAFTSNNKQH